MEIQVNGRNNIFHKNINVSFYSNAPKKILNLEIIEVIIST